MKKIQKTHKKQYLDLPYDCLGEIFYFYLEDVADFFTIFYTSKELSSLVCYYANNVEFTVFSIPSINSKNETLVKGKFSGVCNEKIILAVKILNAKFSSTHFTNSNFQEDRLIDFLKLFKNIKKISLGWSIRRINITDKMFKMLSTTSLESISFVSYSVNDEIKSSGGLTLLPKSVKELVISPCNLIDDFKFLSLLKLKKVDVSWSKITDKDLVQFHFPKCLLEVNIGGCKKISCEGFKTLFRDSVIEKLIADHTNICNTSLSFLPKTLKELNILRCKNISDEGIKHLAKTKIKKLDIDDCENITKEGFSYLTEVIEELDSSSITSDECLKEISKLRIKKLNCSYCGLITNKGLSFLPSTLKVLVLYECKFSNLDYINIKNYDSIEVLQLGRCKNLSNEGIKNLVKFKNLKKLDFQGCSKLGDEGLNLKFIPNTLKELNICGVEITNLKFLTKFKNLERLNISYSDTINDEDLKFFPQKISWLNLGNNNKLTDDGLKKLQCLENLTYLDLRDCVNITNSGVFYVIKKSTGKLKEFFVYNCLNVNCTKEQFRKNFSNWRKFVLKIFI